MIGTLSHERTQYPVGQGFFHSGSVQISGFKFNYVYDCGATNNAPLAAEIRKYSDRARDVVDVLFLSHLDKDHVSGLDRLLALISVQTVVLPYLTTYERALLAAQAEESDDLSADYVQLVGNPVGWFRARGVVRIIFITGENHENLPNLPEVDPINPPDDSGRDHTNRVISENKEERLVLDPGTLANGKSISKANVSEGEIIILPDLFPIPLSLDGELVNWGFLSFVYPELALQKEFAQALAKEMAAPIPIDAINNADAPPVMTEWLLDILQNREKRDRLAKLYKSGFKNRNLTSLSLYSGALKPNKGYYKLIGARPPSKKEGNVLKTEVGWLGTGDADLRDVKRRTSFLAHYNAVAPFVATMALPHHGSRHNFDETIVAQNVSLCVVGVATRGKYGHPHPEVEEALRERNLHLRKVTDITATRLIESFELVPKTS